MLIDVILFVFEEEGEGEVEIVGVEMLFVLGDIIISVDCIRE